MGRKEFLLMAVGFWIMTGAYGCFTGELSLEEKTEKGALKKQKNVRGTIQKKKVGSHSSGITGSFPEGMILEPSYQVGGGNPFMGLGGAGTTGSTAVTQSGAPMKMPTASTVASAPNIQMFPDLPLMQDESIALPSVPDWNSNTPILMTGPPVNLRSLLSLRVRGVAFDHKGNKNYAIIEQPTIGKTSPLDNNPMGPGFFPRTYIVSEGESFTEYNVKVKKITKNFVVLVKGNQKIVLALTEKKKGEETPVFYDPQRPLDSAVRPTDRIIPSVPVLPP